MTLQQYTGAWERLPASYKRQPLEQQRPAVTSGDESSRQGKILEQGSTDTEHFSSLLPMFLWPEVHPCLSRVYPVLEMAKETDPFPLRKETRLPSIQINPPSKLLQAVSLQSKEKSWWVPGGFLFCHLHPLHSSCSFSSRTALGGKQTPF